MNSEADTEFAIGRALYTNADIFEVTVDGDLTEIRPKPTPYVSITLTALLITAFFVGFAYVLHRNNVNQPIRSFSIVAAVALLAVGGYVTISIWQYNTEQKSGPVLMHDSSTGLVTLPRLQVEFPADSIEYFQHLSSYSPSQSQYLQGRRVTEINMVVRDAGLTMRYGLLTSAVPLDKLESEISALRLAPVRRQIQHRLELRKRLDELTWTDERRGEVNLTD
ncbi:hypothetical protein FYK55_28540 [Roseiconus nitratireducens]|uniref:Uncharacterized protein n=1 Tax=Roseiconus nitratireducens TaxID=2605748 RepID=A0A5M6CN59_9BACT|nr:hypothetical protein [Roseiconus nitratireducens]KAA5535422.1 hypothetical protein FYK55_28540 [Roseiconus nitratireducens]